MRLSERVQGFITERKSLRGMDPDEVAGANGVFLKMADLEALCNLAKRYEDAPVVTVTIVGQPEHGGGYDVYSIGNDYQPGNPMKAYAGQRVRIVLDKEGV